MKQVFTDGGSPSHQLARALGTDSYARALEVLNEAERGLPQSHENTEPLTNFVQRARGRLLHAHGELRALIEHEIAECMSRRWEQLGAHVDVESASRLNGVPQEWYAFPQSYPPPLRIDTEQIESRVKELADQISLDFMGAEEVHVVGVLKSAVPFTVDLVRALSLSVHVDWVRASAYGRAGVTADGSLSFDGWAEIDPRDNDVIVVDDAMATGTTYAWLRDGLLERGAASVRLCTLMFAEDYSLSGATPDYFGFSIDWGWPVGYGIDYRERYRNLPGLHQVQLAERACP